MKFLFLQMTIVILVCIFIAALSNLNEFGISGWIIAGSAGYCLYRIYRHLYYSLKQSDSKVKWEEFNSETPSFSRQVRDFMFGDATGARDDW